MEAANKMAADSEAMRRANEEERLGFELRLAGALSVTAAKALLAEHGGDVAKLKEAEPGSSPTPPPARGGATGLEPAGAAKAADKDMKR